MKAYLIGAGFSTLVGYPLGRDLWAKLKDTMNRKAEGKQPMSRGEFYGQAVFAAVSAQAATNSTTTKSDISHAWAGVREWFRSAEAGSLRGAFEEERDIELLVTKILASSYGIEPGSINGEFTPHEFRKAPGASLEWTQQCEWILRVVETSLNMFFLWTHQDSDYRGAASSNVISEWLTGTVADGDVLLTTNYDLVLERFLWESHRWNPNDGYAMPFHVTDLAPLDDLRSPQLSIPSSNLLLKLHGSAGWYTNTDTGAPFVGLDALAGMCFGRDEGGLPNEFKYENSALVAPGYAKELYVDRIPSIWACARKKLANADTLCIIGYSFPPPDRAIRSLVRGVKESARVLIVDPNPDVSKSIEVLLGRPVKAVCSSFTQWVSRGCDGLESDS